MTPAPPTTSICDIPSWLTSLAGDLGYERAMLAFGDQHGQTHFVSNYIQPEFEYPGDPADDPLLREVQRRHCNYIEAPIHWDLQFFSKCGFENLWEAGNAVGFNSGIVGIHLLPKKQRFTFYLDRDQPWDGSDAQLIWQMHELQRQTAALAGHTLYHFEGELNLLQAIEQQAALHGQLTASELSSLAYIWDGLTPGQINQHLGRNLFDRRIERELAQASRKLGQGNALTAASLAHCLGLLP